MTTKYYIGCVVIPVVMCSAFPLGTTIVHIFSKKLAIKLMDWAVSSDKPCSLIERHVRLQRGYTHYSWLLGNYV